LSLGLVLCNRYDGFLGQGYRTILCLPPGSGTAMTVGGRPALPGVYDEHLALDGSDYQATAGGIARGNQFIMAE
jgi:hypothetical protein